MYLEISVCLKNEKFAYDKETLFEIGLTNSTDEIIAKIPFQEIIVNALKQTKTITKEVPF